MIHAYFHRLFWNSRSCYSRVQTSGPQDRTKRPPLIWEQALETMYREQAMSLMDGCRNSLNRFLISSSAFCSLSLSLTPSYFLGLWEACPSASRGSSVVYFAKIIHLSHSPNLLISTYGKKILHLFIFPFFFCCHVRVHVWAHQLFQWCRMSCLHLPWPQFFRNVPSGFLQYHVLSHSKTGLKSQDILSLETGNRWTVSALFLTSSKKVVMN
jgi:hypothetical protein